MTILKILWRRWTAIAHAVADFQARVILVLFYFGVLPPFALGLKLFADPLRVKLGSSHGWLVRPEPVGDVTALARRQF